MAHGMTDEELALLTEEERAGLEDDDLLDEGEEGEEEENADEAAATEGDEDGDHDEPGETDEPDDDKQGDDEQPGRDDGDNGDDEEPAATTSQQVPLIKADLPADFDEQMKALTDRRANIRTEKRALTDKYEDGDITSKEYHDQLDKLDDELSDLNDKRSELKWQENKAKLAQETSQSQVEARWYATVDTFMAEHPEITRNQTLVQVYDAIVQRVTAETMKAGREPGVADLQKAYKQWAEDLGVTPKKPQKEDKAQEHQKQARNVPPTLAKVPAAEANDTDDGKYAYLDRLADKDPIKYEAEIAKLSPSQWEEYSNS